MVFRSISNGKNFRCGNMKCKECGEDIGTEMYLIENHLISKRGNDNDYSEVFHRGCSEVRSLKNAKAWKDYDIAMVTRLESEKRYKNYKIAKKLLKSDYKYVELLLKEKNINLESCTSSDEIIKILKESVIVIDWYMENCSSNDNTTFFNLGTNYIENSKTIIEKYENI